MDFSQALVDAVRAAVGVPAAAYALAAVGLNLQFGYTGLLNFGQVGFLLVGAYGTAFTADHGLPLPLAFLVGVAAAVVLGLILGLPTLRLRAEYLAIVTISAAEIIRLVVRSRPLEGFSDRTLWVMLVGWTLVALTSGLIFLLVRSPWGRVLRGIRDDENATRSFGKNVFAFKLQSLVLGGSIGALAGILLAVDAQFTNADYWQSIFTFFAFTVIIIGGVGRVIGPVVGSMLFWFLLQGADTLLQQALVDSFFGSKLGPTEAGPIRFALVGLVLMLLMIFRPQGLFGSRAETLIEEP